jgi:hypothetical protein
MTYGGPCLLCGEPVEAENAAYPVRGWEVTRSAGGANRILGRERVPGEIAHITCAVREVERARRGIHSQQGAFL